MAEKVKRSKVDRDIDESLLRSRRIAVGKYALAVMRGDEGAAAQWSAIAAACGALATFWAIYA